MEIAIIIILIVVLYFLHAKFASNKSCGLSIVKAIIYIIISFNVLILLFKPNDVEDERPIDNRPKDEIYIYAENYVKRNILTPSTAEFAGYDNPDTKIINLGDGNYSVSSYVDCQNAFGAMVRSKFYCTVKITDDKVITDNLKIE